MRDNNIISILDVLLTETTLVTKANPGSVRIWDRYRRGPRFPSDAGWSECLDICGGNTNVRRHFGNVVTGTPQRVSSTYRQALHVSRITIFG